MVVVAVGGGGVDALVVDDVILGPVVVYGRGVDVPEGVKVVSTTNGVSDVVGGAVVRYGVVLGIGTLGVEDAMVGMLGVEDATIGVSDIYMVENEADEEVDIKVALVGKKSEVVAVVVV